MAADELPETLRIEALPDPGERFQLGERLGSGVYSEVFQATDAAQGGRRVAIKVITLTLNVAADVREEYAVLRRLCSHPNLPDLHGAFLKRGATRREPDQLWFVMELCEGGPITDLVSSLHRQGRRMSEEHIAYVLKEAAKGLWHLHENHVVHRDVKGSNILLTKEGEVKLVDFGLARELASTMGKSGTTLGSPCWMAPEVVAARDADGYDNRADVWALGIVAIELADGKPPFYDMHPTRALFQIVRNPPPALFRPANWTQMFNDFIAECLTKNPEHRPYMVEILEHPFLTELQQNDYTLQQDLRVLSASAVSAGAARRRPAEVAVRGALLQASHTAPPEPLRVEDLAALEPLGDDAMLEELLERFRRGEPYTFAGDVLLALGPCGRDDDCTPRYHAKYQFKSRSDNAPHPFAVADRALQDALHHEEAQHVVLAGEACSGKSAQLRRMLAHFAFLGKSAHNVGERVERCLAALTAFANAATPVHADSTRHLLQLQLTFTRTGKLSGAIFWISMLEKWRIYTDDCRQANFHVLYYLVDSLEEDGAMRKLGLEPGRSYRYLRRGGGAGGAGGAGNGGESVGGGGPRMAPRANNAAAFRRLEGELREALGLEAAALEALWAALAAVLLLGELQFEPDPGDRDAAALRNPDVAREVARLLAVDEKKLCWALLNYCVVADDRTAVRRRHSAAEASAARHVLASTLYTRLLDWLVNVANWRLSFTRAVYGDQHVVNIVDMFGFECHRVNGLEQLFVNTMNEQLQYYYNQRIFAWELQEHREEGLPAPPLRYADNKATLDALLARPNGLLHLLDDPSLRDPAHLLGALRRAGHSPHLSVPSAGAVSGGALEFSVAHYTGTVTYRAAGLYDKNRDFLPPDLIEVLRHSSEPVVQQLFSGRLTKAGNLALTEDLPAGVVPMVKEGGAGAGAGGKAAGAGRRRWGAALVAGAGNDRVARKYNTASRGRFSQSRGLRTASGVFRAAGLEALRALAGGGVHPVRCLRASLAGAPRAAQPELLRQQLRALAVLDTARARRDGYPCRVPFAEFIRRYKFLAFEFDENVEETRENCRLLLVRLKMEGWLMGNKKVFLTYYNEEYLSRLYETQVKKIVRVQTMLRAFLARRVVQKKTKEQLAEKKKSEVKKVKKEVKIKEEEKDKEEGDGKEDPMNEESAALIIQKQYRGYRVRKQTDPALQKSASRPLDEETLDFIRSYCQRWRARTIFQVLMLYRAARRQDLVYFCQQVHLYNQQAVGALRRSEAPAPVDAVDPAVRASTWLGRPRPTVRKLPFRMGDVPFFDTAPYCEPGFDPSSLDMDAEFDSESWDAPMRRTESEELNWPGTRSISVRDQEVQTGAQGQAEAGAGPGPGPGSGSDPRLNTLKRAPFRRDPESLEEFQRRRQQRVAAAAASNAPAPDRPPSAHAHAHANSPAVYKAPKKGSRVNSPVVSSSPAHRKQPAPPPPVFDSPQPYRPPHGAGAAPGGFNNGAGNLHGGGGGGGARARDRGVPAGRSDHIAELQQLGRRGDAYGDDSDEEPPFNFKGMLRKTNCNRASLKRATEKERDSPSGQTKYGVSQVYGADRNFNRKDSLSYNNNPYSSSEVPELVSSPVSKYDAVPPFTRSSPPVVNARRDSPVTNDNWRSDDGGFDRKASLRDQRGYATPPSNAIYDQSRDQMTSYNNRDVYKSRRDDFSVTNNRKESLDEKPNWTNDINRNMSENISEDVGETELVPGIRIQGQVADL